MSDITQKRAYASNSGKDYAIYQEKENGGNEKFKRKHDFYYTLLVFVEPKCE